MMVDDGAVIIDNVAVDDGRQWRCDSRQSRCDTKQFQHDKWS